MNYCIIKLSWDYTDSTKYQSAIRCFYIKFSQSPAAPLLLFHYILWIFYLFVKQLDDYKMCPSCFVNSLHHDKFLHITSIQLNVKHCQCVVKKKKSNVARMFVIASTRSHKKADGFNGVSFQVNYHAGCVMSCGHSAAVIANM